jgi:hypothetical protein
MMYIMKTKFAGKITRRVGPAGVGLLSLALAVPGVLAQTSPTPQPYQQTQPVRAPLSAADLQDLLAPIALYPDALIAIILPASTVPSDVVLGARYVERKGDPAAAAGQPWDDSVKSLVYYPDVLVWMEENLEWTAAVGEAFMDQPADVMNAIQHLRAVARANGTLKDTPEQAVVVQEEEIRIIPANPEIIYIPQYDPDIVFVESYSPGFVPFISFGVGFAVGSWLSYDCDWRHRSVYRGNWVGWNRGGTRVYNSEINTEINRNVTNNVNVVNISGNNVVRWNPSSRSVRQLEIRQRNGGGNVRFATPEARAARQTLREERQSGNVEAVRQARASRNDLLPAPKSVPNRVENRAENRAENRGENRSENPPPNSAASNGPRTVAPGNGDARRPVPTTAPRVPENYRPSRNENVQTQDRPAPTTRPRQEQTTPSAPVAENRRTTNPTPSTAQQSRERREERSTTQAEPRQQAPQVQRPQPRQQAPQTQRQEPRTSAPKVERSEPRSQPNTSSQRQQQQARPQQAQPQQQVQPGRGQEVRQQRTEKRAEKKDEKNRDR